MKSKPNKAEKINQEDAAPKAVDFQIKARWGEAHRRFAQERYALEDFRHIQITSPAAVAVCKASAWAGSGGGGVSEHRRGTWAASRHLRDVAAVAAASCSLSSHLISEPTKLCRVSQ